MAADDRNTPTPDAEPRQIDLGPRSFAGENVAADQRRQAHERGAGLGAGRTENRDARHPENANESRERPEDDLD
jgi:hypothetical protein